MTRDPAPGGGGRDTAGPNPDDAACGNRPEWAGNACLTRPGGNVTGHDPGRMVNALPTKRVTSYTRFGEADRIVETAPGQERTTVTTFDAADRVTAVEITGLGAAVPRVTTTYDPVTGDATATRFPDGTQVSRVFDRLGRLRSYTDADGATTTTDFDRFGKPTRVTDPHGTQTFTYDRAVEPRGLLTSMTDSVGGTMTARYGPDGQLVEQGLPGGVRLSVTIDPAGKPVARTYTRASDGVVVAASSEVENVRGQTISTSGPGSSSIFGYDRWGRLTTARQTATATGICTARTYTYDRRSNRTGRTSRTATTPGTCPTDGTASTTSHTYDSADRAQDPGYTYDAFGRITTTPAGVTNTYYANDLLAAQQTTDQRMTWTLDPVHRQRRYVSERLVNGQWANAVTKVHHYGADGDEPRWTAEDTTNPNDITRYLEAPGDGALAVTTARTGGVVLHLTNLHGDVMGQLPVEPATNTITGALTVLDSDEFGNPLTTATTTARYGWLGAHQRSGDTLGDVLLMGVRVYHPATGRFWQPDPEPGGGATPYDYCYADPVNCTDLDGRAGFWNSLVSTVARIAEVASWIPGPIGAAAGGISALAYASQGNWRKAGEMALTAAANLVGAGAAVRVGMRIVSAAARTVRRAAAGASRATRAVARAVRRCHSFLPSTEVLLADGTSAPISEVRPGDMVAAVDPSSGRTTMQPIIEVIAGLGDKDLVDLRFQETDRIVTATAHHAFWVEERGWVAAAQTRPGDRIQGLQGMASTVTEVRPRGWQSGSLVFDLTVAQAHTYIVVVDEVALLVHNCTGLTTVSPSSRSAYRQARRHWGVEARARPIERHRTPQGRSYVFVNNRGQRVVINHQRDRRHGNHWEGGIYRGVSRRDSRPTFREGVLRGRRRGTGTVVAADDANRGSVMSADLKESARQRLARIRARQAQEGSLPALRKWWEELTGDELVIMRGDSLVYHAATLLGISSDYIFDMKSVSRCGAHEWAGVISKGRPPEALTGFIERLGKAPLLAIPQLSAVGLIDLSSISPSFVAGRFISEGDGDMWAMFSRALDSAVVVNWDVESENQIWLHSWLLLRAGGG